MLKICLDPGHGFSNRRAGQYDPGAEAAGIAEADVALQWALTCKVVLVAAGFAVFLTRDDKTDPDPVGTRDNRAMAAGCNLFIAFHCNAASGTATGVETYYRDGPDKTLAALVQRAALAATGLRDRGLKLESSSQHTRLAVLDFVPPACLLEAGFLDNPTDRARLLEREVRIAFAERLRDGLLAWNS